MNGVGVYEVWVLNSKSHLFPHAFKVTGSSVECIGGTESSLKKPCFLWEVHTQMRC